MKNFIINIVAIFKGFLEDRITAQYSQGKKDALYDFFGALCTLNALYERTKMEYKKGGLNEMTPYQLGISDAIGIIESLGYRENQHYKHNGKSIVDYKDAKIAVLCSNVFEFNKFLQNVVPESRRLFVRVCRAEHMTGLYFKDYVLLYNSFSIDKRCELLHIVRSRLIIN